MEAGEGQLAAANRAAAAAASQQGAHAASVALMATGDPITSVPIDPVSAAVAHAGAGSFYNRAAQQYSNGGACPEAAEAALSAERAYTYAAAAATPAYNEVSYARPTVFGSECIAPPQLVNIRCYQTRLELRCARFVQSPD